MPITKRFVPRVVIYEHDVNDDYMRGVAPHAVDYASRLRFATSYRR